MENRKAGKNAEKGRVKSEAAGESPGSQKSIVVFAAGSAHVEAAESLAKRLGTQTVQEKPDTKYDGLVIQVADDGLSLVGNGLALHGDFARMLPRIKPANLQRELLVKAAKVKDAGSAPTAIDATAGLGEDSLLLAAAGFSVQLYEYNPVIAALLKDAMLRAAEIPEMAEIVGRMRLFEEDSLTALPKVELTPDVILLDPMFPARQKSALVKKKFQLLQKLEIPCADEEELMHAAMAARPHKIVIKRPVKGSYLTDRKPSYSLKGKSIRYDCLVLP